MQKTCCFFGDETENPEIKSKLENVLINLVENENVSTFLFGKKSYVEGCAFSFGSKLKKSGKNIKFVIYDEKHDLNDVKFKLGRVKLSITDIYYMFFDEVRYYNNNDEFEKHKQLIDDSDYCIFCFDEKNENNFNFLMSYAKATNKQIYDIF